jgi:hypothetical protein
MNAKPRHMRFYALGAVAIAAAAAVLAITVTNATDGDGNEPPITGDALQRASEAALAHTGGGQVTETEVGDEESYYEVEVTLDNGTQIDVQLDQQFNVVGSSGDSEEGDDDDGEGEDEDEDD